MKEETEPSEEEITALALLHAKEAFQKYLEDEGYDAAYWDIRFTAWRVDAGFENRLSRFEIESEIKENK